MSVAEVPPLEVLLDLVRTAPTDPDAITFRAYVEELARKAAAQLCKKPKVHPGADAVVQSAFASILNNYAPPAEALTDPEGLWRPLLEATIRRHCNKWNSHYRTKKRNATVVSLAHPGVDVVDRAGSPDEPVMLAELCQRLEARLTARQARIASQLLLGRHTRTEIAALLNVAERTVKRDLATIRRQLDLLLNEAPG